MQQHRAGNQCRSNIVSDNVMWLSFIDFSTRDITARIHALSFSHAPIHVPSTSLAVSTKLWQSLLWALTSYDTPRTVGMLIL